jgi:predicted nuclease of restriction endonuclease-like (RecB) superfamily
MKNDPTVLATFEYRRFIEELKARVTDARISAARHVNRDMILLYWDIGRGIVEKQKTLGWGESVIDRISGDLRAAFPAATGFSPRNLRGMKRFYLAYTDEVIWRQPVAKLAESTASRGLLVRRQAVAKLRQHKKGPQVAAKLGSERVIEILQQLISEIPWGHNVLILNKLSDPAARLHYLRGTAQFGWSSNVLLN